MRKLVLLSLALALSAQAGAKEPFKIDDEQQVGTRFLQAAESVDAQRGRAMQKLVAHCIYDRDKQEAVRLLTNSDFSRIDFDALGVSPDKAFEKFEISSCIEFVMSQNEYKMYMQFPLATMRNLLAEEAYLDDHRDGLTLAADASEAIEQRKAAGARAGSIAVLEDCLTFNGAGAAHALLRSRPSSRDESTAFQALTPALKKCMPSTDKETSLNMSLVRQMVADGMWSRGYYQSGGAGETAK